VGPVETATGGSGVTGGDGFSEGYGIIISGDPHKACQDVDIGKAGPNDPAFDAWLVADY
jgi:hypothetical protein